MDGAYTGLSCYIQSYADADGQSRAIPNFPGTLNPPSKAEEKLAKDKKERYFKWFVLPAQASVPRDVFLVEHDRVGIDEMAPWHVTISVSAENGLDITEVPDSREMDLPALFLVHDGAPQWQEHSYFKAAGPDWPEWVHCLEKSDLLLRVFEEIFLYVEAEEAWAAKAFGDELPREKPGYDILDLVFERGVKILRAYRDTEAWDPNDFGPKTCIDWLLKQRAPLLFFPPADE
jgi:hypothetical protein